MAEYTITRNNEILKDGHTMFPVDILKDLKRKSYLEERLSQYVDIVEDDQITPEVNYNLLDEIFDCVFELTSAITDLKCENCNNNKIGSYINKVYFKIENYARFMMESKLDNIRKKLPPSASDDKLNDADVANLAHYMKIKRMLDTLNNT